jgi:hypothetical protein
MTRETGGDLLYDFHGETAPVFNLLPPIGSYIVSKILDEEK